MLQKIGFQPGINKQISETTAEGQWVVGDNLYGDQWIGKVNGAIKTKEEAQAIVTGEIEAAQAAYDALSAEEQANTSRPVVYNLP